MSNELDFIQHNQKIMIQQKKEWLEVLSSFEGKNKYQILGESGEKLGFIVEESHGFLDVLKRMILRGHRPLKINVLDNSGKKILYLHRPFFWFFSDLYVEFKGQKFGSIHRKFSILFKKYELLDSNRSLFAKFNTPFWKIWTFEAKDIRDKLICTITKKWQGLFKEALTDADAFLIRFDETTLSKEQKIVLFAAALSIDFDYFEDNQGVSIWDFVD